MTPRAELILMPPEILIDIFQLLDISSHAYFANYVFLIDDDFAAHCAILILTR